MTHEETIKRIQELVPSVMELEFGCEVILYSEEYSKNRRILKVLDKRHISGIDTIVEVCENNSNGVSYIFYPTKNELKILGKPITLSVVLEAIREANVGFVFVTHSGTLHKKIGIEDTAHTYLGIWNLSKDNFNDQSEETKAFISNLLK